MAKCKALTGSGVKWLSSATHPQQIEHVEFWAKPAMCKPKWDKRWLKTPKMK